MRGAGVRRQDDVAGGPRPLRDASCRRRADVRVPAATMHAKTFVVDGLWSAITTMNFDNRSLAYNNEVALLARDARLGAAVDSLFVEDLRFADEIRLDAFSRRPWIARVLERAASAIASLL